MSAFFPATIVWDAKSEQDPTPAVFNVDHIVMALPAHPNSRANGGNTLLTLSVGQQVVVAESPEIIRGFLMGPIN